MPNRSLSPHHTGRAGFPHPAFPDTLAAGVRRELTYTVVGFNKPKSARTPYQVRPSGMRKDPLAPTTQVLDHATTHVVTDLSKHPPWISQAEVVHPTFQVSVNLSDELRNGFPPLPAGGHSRPFRHFPLHLFRLRTPAQILIPP